MALIFSLTRLGGREARRRSVLAIGVQKADTMAFKKPVHGTKSRLDLSRTCVCFRADISLKSLHVLPATTAGMAERAATSLNICLSDPHGRDEAVAQEGAQK
jgi:hypothetical protein